MNVTEIKELRSKIIEYGRLKYESGHYQGRHDRENDSEETIKELFDEIMQAIKSLSPTKETRATVLVNYQIDRGFGPEYSPHAIVNVVHFPTKTMVASYEIHKGDSIEKVEEAFKKANSDRLFPHHENRICPYNIPGVHIMFDNEGRVNAVYEIPGLL